MDYDKITTTPWQRAHFGLLRRNGRVTLFDDGINILSVNSVKYFATYLSFAQSNVHRVLFQ
jgi:hypothetical protein